MIFQGFFEQCPTVNPLLRGRLRWLRIHAERDAAIYAKRKAGKLFGNSEWRREQNPDAYFPLVQSTIFKK